MVHINSLKFEQAKVPVIGSGISFEQKQQTKIINPHITSFNTRLCCKPGSFTIGGFILLWYHLTINIGLHKTPWSKVIKHLMGIIQNESSFPQSMISSQFSIFFLNLFISVRNTFQEVLNFICFENLVPVC